MIRSASTLSDLVQPNRWDPQVRRFIVWLIHGLLFAVAGTLAFQLRFDLLIPPNQQGNLLRGLAVWVVVKLIVFRAQGLHHGWWAFVSLNDAVQLGFSNLLGSAVSAVLLRFLILTDAGFPRSVLLIDLLVCSVLTVGVRAAARIVHDASQQRRSQCKRRVLIYGAGRAGNSLLREILTNPTLGYRVVGFIDDNPNLKGVRMQGVPVIGTGSRLPQILADRSIEEVLISAPSASRQDLSRIIAHCASAGVKFKTVPGMSDIIAGRALIKQIRDVSMEDLLGRREVHMETDRVRQALCGQTVMVTGAGGSIGSELCRQLAHFAPKAIIGFEVGETALFNIEREMRAKFPDVEFVAEIGSIQSPKRIAEVLQVHRPSTVYHAAAYKHVPLMERHMFEAVENNVVATYHLARAASAEGVGTFVMISSDKAVRPTNVMGASKRVAELVVRSFQRRTTRFVSVRFGNVLGSNGSVIPVFKEQIAAGGPVTVTHPDMQRFFMTVPEASQLVLQASVLGKGGEIFVLNMGTAVKIVDVATTLITLSGLKPHEDIKIEFTGIRPGEKLYEELSLLEEGTIPTPHSQIKVFLGQVISDLDMRRHVEELKRICSDRDAPALLRKLRELVPDYAPSDFVSPRVSMSEAPASDTVVAGAGS